MRWKLWYGDASAVAGSSREDWSKAPSRNVQVLVTMQETGRGLEHGGGEDHKHAYVWFPGDEFPTGVDYAGLWDYCQEVGYDVRRHLTPYHFEELVRRYDVKLGRSIPSERFWEIVRMADEDSEIPRNA